MLDENNNFQYIGSNWTNEGVTTDVVEETFSHCDRITDKTLFPMENVRSEAVLLYGIGNQYAYVNRSSWRPTYAISKGCSPAIPPPIDSEKSTQGCQGITVTLVTSGDLVQFCQN